MKKIILISIVISATLVIYSCDDPQISKIYPELFKQIVGRWELVSESNEFYKNGVLQHSWVKYDYPWIEQNGDTTNLLYLNFKYTGRVSRESEDDFVYGTKYWWGVTDNEFWFRDVTEGKCEIFQLNDTIFFFSYTYVNDNTHDLVYPGIYVEISTFALKREL